MSDEQEILAADFTLALFNGHPEQTDAEAVKKWLEEEIHRLLEKDYNRLLSILYRIDVSEKKARSCFGGTSREAASCLAGLIWERQMQKAKNRMKS